MEQDRTVDFLARELERLGGGPVKRAETHISLLLLGRELVWKLKKAVRLPYLDFTTPEQRLACCERELELNRRTAPDLYRAVRRVTGGEGDLVLDGKGALVDAVVEMVRFDEAMLLDRMAGRGELSPRLLTELAAEIARFHAAAPVPDLVGTGSGRIARVLEINEAGLRAGVQLLGRERVQTLIDATREAFERQRPLLDERQRAGHVRHCHGDLHLRNIVAVGGRPVLFDCLEFNEEMAVVDLLYDLAFLLMDLWHLGLRAGANLVLNRYLDQAHEAAGLPLLPLFMSMRAAVRCHVAATRASGLDVDSREAAVGEATAYLDLALDLLRPRDAMLVAVGGRSGTGKSTVAAAIAADLGPVPGARVLSSDRVRKRLQGVAAETRLPADAYRSEVSERVYRTVREEASALLALGQGVVADAVFDRLEDREAIGAVAAARGLPFAGFWLEAPEKLLLQRIAARRGDPSDADAAVLRHQLAHDVGPMHWQRVDASGDAAGRIRELLARRVA